MNKSVFNGITLFVSAIISLFVLVAIITSSGSNIAAFAKYLAIGSFVLGFVGSRLPFYLLVVYAATSDFLKRLLVIEGAFSRMDITFVLMMSPLLLSGLFIGQFLKCVMSTGFTRLQVYALLVGVGLSVLNLAIETGGTGLFGLLQAGANVASYFFLPFCALTAFKNTEEYLPLLRFAALIFVAVAIHGINQYFFGYPDFEYNYLKSGFTSIVDHSNIDKTRPFSTLSSPGALAYCCGLLAVTCFFFASPKKRMALSGERRVWYPTWISLLFFVVLMLGCFVSKSRTQMLMICAIFPLFLCLSSQALRITASVFGFITVVSLFFLSGYILDADLIEWYQRKTLPVLTNLTGLDGRYFTLSTMTIRLEGWDNILNNPEFRKPFGNPTALADRAEMTNAEMRAAGIRSHDMLSEALLKFGWVPLIFVGSILVIVSVKVNSWLRSLPKRTFEFRASRLGILALIAAYLGTIAGGALSAYPVCFILNLVFTLVYLTYRDLQNTLQENS